MKITVSHVKRALSMTLAAALVLLVAVPATAQDATTQDPAAELAKQAQNPIANLISLPFQNNTNFNMGPNQRTQNVFNIQPVIPFNFGGLNLITRTIAPVVYRPVLNEPTGGTFGLGDINATFFFSPADSGRVTWGVGPVLYLPTATDEALGTDRWSMGPSAVVLTMPGPWVIGGLVSNVWSFAGGDEDDGDVNSFLFQYFINYNFPSRWYLTSAPILTANWEALEGNQWVVPFGGGFGKVFQIGGQPVNGSVHAYWNAVRPDLPLIQPPVGGLPIEDSTPSSWTVRFQLQLLFPR